MITMHCTYPDGETSEARFAVPLDSMIALYDHFASNEIGADDGSLSRNMPLKRAGIVADMLASDVCAWDLPDLGGES